MFEKGCKDLIDAIIIFMAIAVAFYLLGWYTYKVKIRKFQKEQIRLFDEKQRQLMKELPDILSKFGTFSKEEIKYYTDIIDYHRENVSGTCLSVLESLLMSSSEKVSKDEVVRCFDALAYLKCCQGDA